MNVPEGYADGDRHGWLAIWCPLIARIGRGQAAAELLTDIADLPERGMVVTPQMWMWEQTTGVGRKGRSRDGGLLRTPVRVKWATNSLAFITDHQVTVPWTATLTKDEAWEGACTFTPSSAGFGGDEVLHRPADTVEQPLLATRQIEALLRSYAEDGIVARWEAMEILQPMVERAVVSANTYLSHDVALISGTYRSLLDDITMETLRDEIMFGIAESAQPSVVAKILDRSLEEERFDKVEPLRHLRLELRRAAQDCVRRTVGDPHIGSRIRALALKENTFDPALVRDLYNNGGGTSGPVGLDRVKSALSIVPVTARPYAIRR